MSSAVINTRYYANLDINPVFKMAIEKMIQSGLYSENLIAGPAIVTPVSQGGILKYKNGAGVVNSAIALDVITDVISKSVLIWYRDGSSVSDPSKNIAISTDTTYLTDLNKKDNVKDAITLLADEIYNLKQTITTLLTALAAVPGMQAASGIATQSLAVNAFVTETLDPKLQL